MYSIYFSMAGLNPGAAAGHLFGPWNGRSASALPSSASGSVKEGSLIIRKAMQER